MKEVDNITDNSMNACDGMTLRINLSTKESRVEDHRHLFDDYFGGIAVKILYDELNDWVTPYDPMNKVIISSGALVGTVAPGACKMSISTLGPVTGGWATSSSDSYVAHEMKYAGYSNIIIEGRSNKPCYLYICNDIVEIRDASNLWGLTTWDTLDTLRNEFNDPNLHIISIGPAGENLSRGACVIQDRNRAFGRCGTGAVLGSKQLKAVVVKGSRLITVAQPNRFIERTQKCRARILNSQTAKNMARYGTVSCFQHKQTICGIPYKNGQDCSFPEEYLETVNPQKMIDKYQVTRQGFPGCVLCCGRVLTITEGPYKGLTADMNQWEVVGTILGKCAVHNSTFMLKINALCNQLGLDVDIVGGSIAWAMECFDRGLLNTDDTGGLQIRWGDEEVILKLTQMMSAKEGFGNILAEGSARAADIIGHGSEKFAQHVKKQDLYELMRSANGMCLGASVSTRGGGHTTGVPTCEMDGTPMDEETSMRVFGVPAKYAGDNASYFYKAQLVYAYEIIQKICNTIGICLFNSASYNVDFTNLDDIAELLSAATGKEYTVEDLERTAMRLLHLEKALNLRFTNYERKDDYPPVRETNEPIPTGSRAGWRLDLSKFETMLDEYYELHAWDKKTSYPKREAYERWGLGYVASDMSTIGKLGNC